jgi:DNA-binding response OmpR family regulator
MVRLIITADDNLYERLAKKARAEGDTTQRATNALDGFKQASSCSPGMILLDMSLHAADTLVETLRSRPQTCAIPLLVVKTDERLPFELRRLCTDVLEADAL